MIFLHRLADYITLGAMGTMPQKALRWLLDHPEVSTVIPGASKISQAESNAAASSLPALDRVIHAKLRELYEKEIAQLIRGTY